jgi:hypothetical protein
MKNEKLLKLMDDASLLINSKDSSSEKRIFKIDVSGIDTHEIKDYMKKLLNNTKNNKL